MAKLIISNNSFLSGVIENYLAWQRQRKIKVFFSSLANKKKPIVIGPWLSEVGFEILYWIPFIRWAVKEFKLDKHKLIIVSRGGVKNWYEGINDNYIDIFEFYSSQQFKQNNKDRMLKTQIQKQTSISDFDKEIINKVKQKHNLNDFSIIHPMYMYKLFQRFWSEAESISSIEKFTSYTLYEQIGQEYLKMINLPEKYIAVKFYFNDSFPKNSENIDFIKSLTNALTLKNNLVLLNTGLGLDDHSEINLDSKKIINVASFLKPENNLAIQTEIIAHSQGFLGTYGGFSYLAPFCSIPSYSFYSDEKKFIPAHLEAAHRACRRINVARENVGQKEVINNKKFIEFTAMKIKNFQFLYELFKG